MGPKSRASALPRDRRAVRTQVRVEAETGVGEPHTKECPEPPEARRGTEQMLSQSPRGVWPCRLLDFRLLASRAMGEELSVVLSPRVCPGGCRTLTQKV